MDTYSKSIFVHIKLLFEHATDWRNPLWCTCRTLGTTQDNKEIVSTIFCPKLQRDVHQYIKRCSICLTYKGSPQNIGLYTSLPISESIREDLSIDFILVFPKISHGVYSIMVFMISYQKWSILSLVKKNFEALNVAHLFFQEIIGLHWIPHSLTSDRDVKFISLLWLGLWKCLQTKLYLSSTYHPQNDG